ncbi:hypothetical protein BpHYR1_014045 [Brachionus plicatilis]|uniref:RNA-directed DNA polymerase from mobile element jockey-like n=1 Tax=Brachionus plicatilis TaxID=10195 RepID=A0A3M7T612_BRAPC|nr:hypothetical protein BpHYR1_014045 [Brachionus plicatilis]
MSFAENYKKQTTTQRSIFNSKKAKKLVLIHKNLPETYKSSNVIQDDSNWPKKMSITPTKLDHYLNLPDFVLRMDTPRKLTVNKIIVYNLVLKLNHLIFVSFLLNKTLKDLKEYFVINDYRIPLFDNAAPQPRTHHWRRRYTKSRPC